MPSFMVRLHSQRASRNAFLLPKHLILVNAVFSDSAARPTDQKLQVNHPGNGKRSFSSPHTNKKPSFSKDGALRQ